MRAEASLRKLLISAFILSLAYNVSASTGYGDGSDGSLTVTGSEVVNDYTYLKGDEASGSASLSVNDASGFSEGDEVMIIQMQNGSGNGVAGRYEFRELESTSSTNLNLKESLDYYYYSGSFNQASAESTQVIRIPEYDNVEIESGGSIQSDSWNGYKGGIVSFRVKDDITIDGSIDASASKVDSRTVGQSSTGFRGAETTSNHDSIGMQGESYSGYGTYDAENSNQGGGAGGGAGIGQSCDNCEGGAGGGSYGTKGTAGEESNLGTVSNAGRTYGDARLDRIFLGSGGGAGANDGSGENGFGGAGGAGAGAIYITGKNVTIRGDITAEGADGQDAWEDGGDQAEPGGGGAGSGGTIFLRSQEINISGSVIAQGGTRGKGQHPSYEDDGGSGGDGRIRLDYSTATGLSNINPSPGYTGDAPDFCDERGPQNECFVKTQRDISSQDVEISEPFNSFQSSELFSSTFTPLTVQGYANISGAFRGSIKFSAKSIRLKNGASFRPENGRILLDTID